MAFFISSSPYAHVKRTTPQLMSLVIFALIPVIWVQCYFFGYGVLIQIFFAAILSWSFEAIVLKIRSRPIKSYLFDHSALLTGILLAISIPPLAPWWILIIGLFFAIVVSKHLYGGLGQNIFNPAMIAYVVLLISFPVQMTSWNAPISLVDNQVNFFDSLHLIFTGATQEGLSLQQVRTNIDGITMATPLDSYKTGLKLGLDSANILSQAPFSSFAGIGWQWVNLTALITGSLLIKLNVTQWQIPISMLATLTLLTAIKLLFDPNATPVLLQLFSGATMLGAFFIATDPVSASTTKTGRLIYGSLIGLIIFVIRSWGGYPDGVAFAVLLANMTVPLIDYYTKPRTYGYGR